MRMNINDTDATDVLILEEYQMWLIAEALDLYSEILRDCVKDEEKAGDDSEDTAGRLADLEDFIAKHFKDYNDAIREGHAKIDAMGQA